MPARDLARLASPEPPWVHLAVLGAGEGVEALEAAPPGFVVRRIDGDRCRTRTALFAELAGAFAFPAYFGATWDALDECLADLSWLPAAGYRLLVTRADAVLADEGPRRQTCAATLVATLEDTGREWGTARSAEATRPVRAFHSILVVSPRRREMADWGLPELRIGRDPAT